MEQVVHLLTQNFTKEKFDAVDDRLFTELYRCPEPMIRRLGIIKTWYAYHRQNLMAAQLATAFERKEPADGQAS